MKNYKNVGRPLYSEKSFFFILCTQQVYSDSCDKEKKAFLEVRKAEKKAYTFLEKEKSKASSKLMLKKNILLLNKNLKIRSEKKCRELWDTYFSLLLKNPSYYIYGYKNMLEYRKSKKSQVKTEIAEEAYDEHCGNKLDNILYKVHPPYKKAELNAKKVSKRRESLEDDLYACKMVYKK